LLALCLLVVLGLAALGEGFERPPEGRHAVRDVPGFILRNSQLNVREHELVVDFRGLGVVLGGLCKFAHDEENYNRRSDILRRWDVISLTLATVVVDIRVIRIELDSFLEALERLRSIALLHMHTSYLHQTLCESREKVYRLLKVGLGASDIASKEPERTMSVENIHWRKDNILESTPKVKSLRLSNVP
jgi:hypothetical protein